MGEINVSALFQQLHAVAMAIQVMMTDYPYVPIFTLCLDIRDGH
jgi:hypothetical protein